MNKTLWLILSFLPAIFVSAARVDDAPGVLFPAPHFGLTDQNDKPFSDADLKGKTWVVDFVFTRCGGPCPMMTQRMIKLAKQIDSPNVRFVSISVDPAYDTPAVLREYAKVQGATDPRFVFLTGDSSVIYDLAQKGFKVTALPAKGEEGIQHDERFLLFDTVGNCRGVYHSKDDASMAQLVADANALSSTPNVWIARFPAVNASLNATAGILLCLAMILIQVRWIRAHGTVMILAVIASTAFLACYLTFHYIKVKAGTTITRFPESPLRPLYLVILISHTILAVVVVPLVVMTLVRAARRQWERHRRIARPTFWIWLYVSVTGVVVYWMLYQLAPKITVPV
jgi:protein SCO1/2